MKEKLKAFAVAAWSPQEKILLAVDLVLAGVCLLYTSKREEPDFMRELVSVAQVGRSPVSYTHLLRKTGMCLQSLIVLEQKTFTQNWIYDA